MFGCDFDGQTVLIAGAGCPAGPPLADRMSAAGARVIVMDRDEASVMKIAAQAPRQIEALRLDVTREDHCRYFGRIWEDEPIAALVHLQALRNPARPGQALRSIAMLSLALRAGLEAGTASATYLFDEQGESAESDAMRAAFCQIAPSLQRKLGLSGAKVNGIALAGNEAETGWGPVFAAICVLAGQAGVDMGGAVLPLLPRSH